MGRRKVARKERGKRVLRWEGRAFTWFYLMQEFLFDPASDGFPSVGSWMSRDQGGVQVPFCLP